MNVAESKDLKKGNRVYWRGDATNGGIITEMSWDAVTIRCSHDHLGQWSGGDRAPWGHARDPKSASKAYCCIGIGSDRSFASGTKGHAIRRAELAS